MTWQQGKNTSIYAQKRRGGSNGAVQVRTCSRWHCRKSHTGDMEKDMLKRIKKEVEDVGESEEKGL